MTIRKNLLIIISVCLASLLAIVYVSSRLILLNSFTRLEEQKVRENVQRAISGLSEDQATLNTIALDYAAWDDTYAFVAGELSNYPQVNLDAQTYNYLHLNLVLIVNNAGQVVYGSGYDLVTATPTPVPAGMLTHITLSDKLLSHDALDSNLTGIVMLPDGPMLVAARPIQTSDYKGPVRGTLIVGRYLYKPVIDQLAATASLSLTYRRADDPQLPADFTVARANISPASPILVQPVGTNTIAGYSLLTDLYGQPAILLQVNLARDIYTQGQASLDFFIGLFMVVGVLFSTGSYIALERLFRSQRDRQAAEAKYKALVEEIPAVTYISALDECSSLLYISPQLKALLGFAPEEWQREPRQWFQQIPPEDRVRVQAERLRTNRTSAPFRSEYPMVAQDGHVVWVRDDAIVLKDATGQPQVLQGIMQDITERKRVEETLRKTEHRFQSLIENASDGIALVSKEGHFLYASPSAKRLFGYQADDSMDNLDIDPAQSTHPEDLPAVLTALSGLIEGPQKVVTLHYRFRHKDGSWRWLESTISNLLAEPSVEALVINFRDITERRWAEEALRESELKFRTIIEQSLEGVALVDEDGIVMEWNQANEKITGLNRTAVIGEPYWDVTMQITDPDRRTEQNRERLKSIITTALRTGSSSIFEKPLERELHTTSGQQGRYIQQTVFPIKTEKGYRIASLTQDISERKQTEETLRKSEERFARMFKSNPAALGITRMSDGTILDANESFLRLFGYRADQVLGHSMAELNLYVGPGQRAQVLELLREHGSIHGYELKMRAYSGDTREVLASLDIFGQDNDEPTILGSFVDITERKHQLEALNLSEEKYRSLIESSNSVIATIDSNGTFHFVNQIASHLLGRSPADIVGKRMTDLFPPDAARMQLQGIQQVIERNEGIVNEAPTVIDGQERWYQNNIQPIRDQSGRAVLAMLNSLDITERKRAEEAVQNSEKRFRALIENGLDNISLLAADGTLLWESPAVIRTLGYKPDEYKGRNTFELIHPDDWGRIQNQYAALMQEPGSRHYNSFRLRRIDGTWRWVEAIVTNLLNEPFVKAMVVNYRDVTERKQAEAEIVRLHRAVESSGEAMFLTDREGIITYVNPAFTSLYGYTAAEVVGQVTPRILKGGTLTSQDYEELWKTILNNQVYKREWVNKAKDGRRLEIEGSSSPIHDDNGNIVGFLAIQRDVTERKQAQEKIRQQMEHLAALNQIDRTITSSFDLHLSLEMLLTHVIAQLGVDAADVLLCNSISQSLEYGAGRGFRSPAIEQTRCRIGEGRAGRVALERRTIYLSNLSAAEPAFGSTDLLATERFKAYYGVPLIAKGQVKGVLEVFHRSLLEADPEWLVFLESLAGQAAIAIDNAMLFDDLQRSNTELLLAYETTLEGWSAALDLRDKETEGHTLRVTEITLQLAREMGIGDEELLQVRRGALLHDIGKMGIPDSILLKPGKLTDDEWAIMRKHPEYAYEVLAPIAYLRRALDIPYCHHEQWNGTGYPRGLKGEAIPLAARIFAVVDVWDALCSNRPYRPAWAEEKVRAYIQSEAGSHFDPRVVQSFLESKAIRNPPGG